VTREAGWHERYFDLTPEQAAENAEASVFLHAFLFRRYVAKFLFELDFWSRFGEDGGTSEGYAERLTEVTGYVYRSDGFVADMDPGFYSADYALDRSAQVRPLSSSQAGDGEAGTVKLLRALPRTQPSVRTSPSGSATHRPAAAHHGVDGRTEALGLATDDSLRWLLGDVRSVVLMTP
jgi:hypothetical protein